MPGGSRETFLLVYKNEAGRRGVAPAPENLAHTLKYTDNPLRDCETRGSALPYSIVVLNGLCITPTAPGWFPPSLNFARS
jgi:hypothetical protein